MHFLGVMLHLPLNKLPSLSAAGRRSRSLDFYFAHGLVVAGREEEGGRGTEGEVVYVA